MSTIATLFLVLIVIAVIGLMLASFWKIFEKAGRPGWEGIVPIYNMYVMLKFVGKPGWWLILFLIPIVNYVFIIWTYNMLSKSFGKDEGFTVGLILLGIVFFPVLAFGDARYIGPYGDKAAFLASRQNSSFSFDQEHKAI